MPSLDVVIPVKNRAIADCIASLRQLGDRVQTLWLCDGGSTAPDTVTTLAQLASSATIKILHRPMQAFNKAVLLNAGIVQSPADLILVSDADILWNAEAIAALRSTLDRHPQAICHIADVVETRPTNVALTRQRYGYRITQTGGTYQVTLQVVSSRLPQRPGCGLVCARRTTLLKLRGYKACFQGWGWEDQDLLMRAQLMDIPVLAAGQVVHQSHPEALRNQFYGGLAPTLTRDRNITTCLRSLQQGHLWGDLSPRSSTPQPVPKIQVQWPHQCCQFPQGSWTFL